MTSKLGALLKNAKAQRKTAFIPYVTAGDPDLDATKLFVNTLVRAGAAIIELGVPFSDPMADGPTNQRANERALKSGTSLARVLAMVGELRREKIEVPLVLFTYFNPVFVMGVEKFAQAARAAGVTAALVLDLPPEEAGPYRAAMSAAGLETVFLAAPTSDDARLKLIDEASTAFIYFVSRTGVTGAQDRLADDLAAQMARLRRCVRNQVAVGFGISTPEHARDVSRLADGVVVGSAIVKIIEENADPAKAAAKMESFARDLVRAME